MIYKNVLMLSIYTTHQHHIKVTTFSFDTYQLLFKLKKEHPFFPAFQKFVPYTSFTTKAFYVKELDKHHDVILSSLRSSFLVKSSVNVTLRGLNVTTTVTRLWPFLFSWLKSRIMTTPYLDLVLSSSTTDRCLSWLVLSKTSTIGTFLPLCMWL